jgi:hypothetical protein
LEIASGLVAGTYTFAVTLQLSKTYYDSSAVVSFSVVLTIGQATTSGLKINGDTVAYQDTYNAASIVYGTPTNFSLQFVLSVVDADSFAYQLADNPPTGVSVSGSTLSFGNVNVGQHSFTINGEAKQGTTVLCFAQITFNATITIKTISNSSYDIILNGGTNIVRNYGEPQSDYAITLSSGFPSNFSGTTTYSLTNAPSGFTIADNNKLRISPTASASPSISFSITASSTSDANYLILDKTQTFTVVINKINFPSSTEIMADGSSSTTLTSLTYGYSNAANYALTVADLPSGTSASYTIDSSGTTSTISSKVSISGSTNLVISLGANAGSYNIKINATLNGSTNYNDITITKTFNLTINSAPLTGISIKAGNLTGNNLTDLAFDNTAQYTLALNNAPSGVNASSYSIVSASTNASYITINGTTLNINSGNTVNSAPYNIAIQAILNGGTNYEDGEVTTTFYIKIIKATASGSLTISIDSNPTLQYKVLNDDYAQQS